MKTSIEPGRVIELTAPVGDVVSGTAYLIGSLLAVATKSAVAAAKFNALVKGIVDLPKADDAWTEGVKLYWDDAAKKITTTSGGNTLVGAAVPPIATVVVALATSADPSDLLISGMTLQVLDYAQLHTDHSTVTVTINGTAHVLTEGTDWTSETSDDVAATNLAAAIDALVGAAASATTDTVTVVPSTGIAATSPTVGRVRLDGVVRV
ncbi:MAG: DUF2190 family protein [Thermoleophilia bacterium]|nr:DUF2190 family protein [Thermoleophilia bacterium]